MQFIQLLLLYCTGAPIIMSMAFLFMGKGMISRMLSSPQINMIIRLRRERFLHEEVLRNRMHCTWQGTLPSHRLRLSLPVRMLDHNLRIMVSHCAGRQLYAVADQIVLVCQNLQRILIVQRIHTALGHGERIMTEFQFAGLFADFVHREINNPTELICILFSYSHRRMCQPACE